MASEEERLFDPGDLVFINTNIVYTGANRNILKSNVVGVFIDYIEPDPDHKKSTKYNFKINVLRCNILVGNKVIDVLPYNVYLVNKLWI